MILRRGIYFIITVWGVVTVTFFMLALAPGDPAEIILGERGTKEAIEQFRKDKGLDKPLYVRYLIYIKDIATLNFGKSIKSNIPIIEELGERLPATFELAFCAMVIAVFFGIVAGVLSAVYRNTFVDFFAMTGALIGVSMPIFWLGLMLIIVFSVALNLFPTGGRMDIFLFMTPITHFYVLDSMIYLFKEGNFSYLGSTIIHLVLPSITLATIPLSIIARITRASMLEVLSSDYIETAKAFGIRQKRIVFYYGLKNALLPIITVVGLQFGALLSGAILTETIFSWPGIGTWTYQGILSRDFPVVQGSVIVISIIFVSINFLVDMLYIKINPKVRIEE